MEKKHRQPGEKKGIHGTFQGGSQGQTGEQSGHKRIRSLSEEVPGIEAMLSDPGEPHKDIPQHSRPEQRMKASGRQQKPGKARRGTHEPLGEEKEWQKRPLVGEEDVSQRHPLLGDETVSMENERAEHARRKMEAERTSKSTSKKKPAA